MTTSPDLPPDGVEGFGLDPFTAAPGDLLRSVADLAPGSLMMATLLMVDRTALAPEDALLYLQLHQRVGAWWAAMEADAVVAAASPEPRIDEFLVLDPRPDHDEERLIRIEDAAREEVAVSLRLAPVVAQRRIDHARLLAGPLAATRTAMEHGEITPAHAAIVCDAAERLSTRLDATCARPTPEAVAQFHVDCHALEAGVLRTARRADTGRTRRAANRAIERIDAEGQRRRREAARSTRDVYVCAAEDGLATLVARLDALTAHAILRAVENSVADESVPGDPAATIGERRAEALAHLVLNAAGASGAPRAVALEVVVPLDALLSGDDGTGALADGSVVGIEQLADLLSDPDVHCALRRIVTDPVDGHVLDVGRRTYEIPAALRRHIVLRDRTCRFPGCARRAARCQIDHAEAWDDGGVTSNDEPGCPVHPPPPAEDLWRVANRVVRIRRVLHLALPTRPALLPRTGGPDRQPRP